MTDQPSTAAGRALLEKARPTIAVVNELAAKVGAPLIGAEWFDDFADRILAIEVEARADTARPVEPPTAIRRVDVTTPRDILAEIDRLRELASAQREWGAVANYDTLRVWLRSEPEWEEV